MRQIFEFPKILINWFLRFYRWLIVEPKKVWITLLPIVAVVIFCWLLPKDILNGSYFCDSLEARFRISGLFLELLGIGTVVKGLNETLKLFLGERFLDMVLISGLNGSQNS